MDTTSVVSGAQSQLSGVTVSSGASMFVGYGGSVSDSVVDGGAFVDVFSSGSVSNLTVNSGGVIDSDGGQIGTLTLEDGAAVVVQASQPDSVYVDSAGDLILASGGTTILDVPLSGEPAGVTFHLQPLSGYIAAVAGPITSVVSGGVSQGITLGVGDLLIVSNGGLARDITVSGGLIEVLSGGVASDLTVEAQGEMQVFNGGVAVSTTVGSGGEELTSSGGLTSGSLVGPGGSSVILDGGVEQNATVVGTSQTISSGGVEIGLTLNSGWLDDVGQLSGGVFQSSSFATVRGEANSVTLLTGAYVADDGETTGFIVGADTTDMVYGAASNTTVEAGGIESAFYQAEIAGATILTGGLLHDYEANLADLSIQSGASLYVENEWGDWSIVSGGSVLSMTVIPGSEEPPPVSISLTPPISLTVTDQQIGQFDSLLTFGEPLIVSSGQTSSGLAVGIGGPVTVLAGGKIVSATIGSAASATLSSGGVASGDAVISGGLETVLAGALSIDAQVSDLVAFAGGGPPVSSVLDVFGQASNPQVFGGAEIIDETGAAVDGALIGLSGSAVVSSGAAASGWTVASGGLATLSSGGSLVSGIIDAGGSAVIGGLAPGLFISSAAHITLVLGAGNFGLDLAPGGVINFDMQAPAVISAVDSSNTLALYGSSGQLLFSAALGPADAGVQVELETFGAGYLFPFQLVAIGPGAAPADPILMENTAGTVVDAQASDGNLTYQEVGGLGPEWSFEGEGDLLGNGGKEFLIENTAGAVVVGEVVSGVTQYQQVGGLGPEWSFGGVGDFLGDGQDQFLIENTAGAVVVADVVSGQARYEQVAALGPEWKFVGVGDFLGDGQDQFLIENAAGAVVVAEVVSGQAQFDVVAGLGPEWSFVGDGDFLADGVDQFLVENTAGTVLVGQVVTGGGYVGWAAAGGLGPEWKFVGAGDFTGDGQAQYLIENSAGVLATGAVSNGGAQYSIVGAVGPEWKFPG